MGYINANVILPKELINEYVAFRELDDGMYMKRRIEG